MKNSAARFIVDAVSALGVDHVFGIPGGLVIPFFNALLDRSEIKLIIAKHEANAVFMAMGYALATGKPGVVITTAGPGITNALTGIASARQEAIPVVHIAGDAPTSSFGRHAFQESGPKGLNAVEIVKHVTKFAAQITRPEAAVATFRTAVATAVSGVPGPVFLSLPLDISGATVPATTLVGEAQSSFSIDEQACREAAGLLATAKRPLLIAGAGCRSVKARQALHALATAFGLPVAVTSKGKGVFSENHRNFLGVMGFGGHPSVIKYLDGGIDVLLVVGSNLNDFSTNAWTPKLKPAVALIQVDLDRDRIGQNYPAALGFAAPAEIALDRIRAFASQQAASRALPPRDLSCPRSVPSDPARLDMFQTIDCLNESAPDNAFFAVDIGEHLSIAINGLRIGPEQSFFTALGFGSMGSSLGTAVGHQMGDPRRRTYVICGDGGFLMNGTELATAVQHRVRTTFLIVNDSRLNMVHLGMREQFGRAHPFTTNLVDFATIARGLGAKSRVVTNKAELAAALREGSSVEGPVVLDLRIDPEARLLGNQRVATLKHFTDQQL